MAPSGTFLICSRLLTDKERARYQLVELMASLRELEMTTVDSREHQIEKFLTAKRLADAIKLIQPGDIIYRKCQDLESFLTVLSVEPPVATSLYTLGDNAVLMHVDLSLLDLQLATDATRVFSL